MLQRQFSCYYHPSTVVFVDDNQRFLNSLLTQLDLDRFSPVTHHSPYVALDFFENTYQADSFIERCMKLQLPSQAGHRVMDIDVQAIHQEIYRANRFNEVSVLVVDYAMPGIMGGRLCQMLKHHKLKTILLTAEADEKIAISLFNEGLIHHYIKKGAQNFGYTLNEKIYELQREYFQEKSQMIVNTLRYQSPTGKHCLSDPDFINFFEGVIQEQKISEYYLLNEEGSFLCLNQQGEASWFLTKTAEKMAADIAAVLPYLDQMPAALQASIKDKKVIKHAFAAPEFPADPKDWPYYFHPVQPFAESMGYYCAYIKAPQLKTALLTEKIASFRAYLEHKSQ